MLWLLIGLLIPWSQALASSSSDELCFLNFDPILGESGVPILGPYAVEKGACQGMAGIMAAFRESARFSPGRSQPQDEQEAARLLRGVMRNHAAGCRPHPTARVVIPGFAHLLDFCRAYPKLFARESVLYNAEIAAIEIAPLWPEFRWRRKDPVESEADRAALHGRLQSLQQLLDRGKSPLLLYFSHVVMVRAARMTRNELRLEVIDPNLRGPQEIVIPYDPDGLPSPKRAPMYWNVTPERRWLGCPKISSTQDPAP